MQVRPPASAPTTESVASPNSLKSLFRDLGGDFKHLPSTESAVVASIGAGLALAVHPVDNDFNQKLGSSRSFFKAGDVVGNTLTLMGASTAAYALGRAFGDDKVAHVGLDLLRAQIVTEVMVQSLKFGVERPRPDGSFWVLVPFGARRGDFATAAVLDRTTPGVSRCRPMRWPPTLRRRACMTTCTTSATSSLEPPSERLLAGPSHGTSCHTSTSSRRPLEAAPPSCLFGPRTRLDPRGATDMKSIKSTTFTN